MFTVKNHTAVGGFSFRPPPLPPLVHPRRLTFIYSVLYDSWGLVDWYFFGGTVAILAQEAELFEHHQRGAHVSGVHAR